MATPKGKGGPPPEASPSPSSTQPSAPTLAPEEQQEANGMERGVPPDAVCAHTSAESCKACEYADPAMNCSWLKMVVGPDSPSGIVWCKLFEPKEGGEQPGEAAMLAPAPEGAVA